MNRCMLKQKYMAGGDMIKGFLECVLLLWHSSEYAYGHLGTSLNFQISNVAQLI